MPSKKSKKAKQRDAGDRTPVPWDTNSGPSSTDVTQLETMSAVTSGHGPSTTNNNANSNSNVLSGIGNIGNIINVNPILNVQSNSGTTVNLGPINVASAVHLPDDADSQEKIMDSLATLIGDRFISDALYDTLPTHAGCMPGTRESILARIDLWIKQDPTRIFWLAGMAGTGKTSIAVTLCRMLWDDMSIMFGGSFFCSRSAGSIARTDVRNILPTLAETLASQNPEFALALAAELKADLRATQKPVRHQLDVLLIKTFEKLTPFNYPIIFVIDGLDECTDEREVAELLTAIADLKINPNVKFVVTSRPEMHIRGTPISNPVHNTILQLHTIKEEEITIDIRRYVTGTLQASASVTTAAWYTSADVEILVRLSNGLFIFASTVLLYVLDKERDKGRKERLHKVIHTATYGSAATASLDKVYEMIVLEAARSDRVDADELRATQRVLATILSARSPLSVLAMTELLGKDADEADDVRSSLERLHSVVHMPADDTEPGVRALHASFGDYMMSRAADHVRLSTTLGDEILTQGCLHVMSKRLHFNVSQSRSSYEPNPATKPDTITLSLEYACLEWIYHIASLKNPSNCDQDINTIFRVRFLFWLEVMSVLQKIQRASAILVVATATIRLSQLAKFFRDARTFVASSLEAINYGAPHIYLSALPFAATDSLVYQTFYPVCTGIVSVQAFGVDQHGSRLVMTLTGHSKPVLTVDCSSDGHLVLSGSSDGTVRVWDIRTGEDYIPPLDCGDGSIHTAAFSPDGTKLTAITEKGDVFTWSLSAGHGSILWQWRLDRGPPKFVTLSPDCSLVASGSGDHCVDLWQVETGKLWCQHWAGTMPDVVLSTTLSPDRAIIATLGISALGAEISLWDVVTGRRLRSNYLGKVTERSAMCFSPDSTRLAKNDPHGGIAVLDVQHLDISARFKHDCAEAGRFRFSPDGRFIASASSDGNVYLFDTLARGERSLPAVFSGHTDRVSSTTFSHDGLYIVSCSDDCTVRIWDTGGSLKEVQTRSMQTDRINSVATASDGTFIVSGSHDHSVRVWNAHTGAPHLTPLLGHKDVVLSVAISQDCHMIASASADKTVRVWESRDGKAIGNPLIGHERAVNSVAFSPDTLWLISGSDDRTVRIWGVATGLPAGPSQLSCFGRARAVAFSPDGRLIAAGDETGQVHLWHAGTKERLFPSLERIGGNVHSICFSSNSRRIVAGGRRGTVAVWDVETRKKLFAWSSNNDQLNCVAFSHDGMLICSGSSTNKSVHIRNATTGKDFVKLVGHTGGVTALALQPDGRSLVSCSDDRTIRVWDLTVARPRPSGDHSDNAELPAFKALKDGWLVSSSGDRLLWVPLEYRKHLQMPPCAMLIAGRSVNIRFENGGWYHGTSWTSCWRENAWKAIS